MNIAMHFANFRILLAILLAFFTTCAAASDTLDKVRESGTLRLGYRTDAQPFAFSGAGGRPSGFSVALCEQVASAVKEELKMPSLAVEFVPVTAANRFEALQQGRIDLSCGTDTPTLGRRASTDFSIPIFLAGTGVLLRSDSAQHLRDALENRPYPVQPIWRGAPGLFSANVVFAVVEGSTIERSLIQALKGRRITVRIVSVPDYASGVQSVRDRGAAALFGDWPVLKDAAAKGGLGADQLVVLERRFSFEPLVLSMRRGDDALRLLVDTALSRQFRSMDMAQLFTRYFGPPDLEVMEFYRSVALPD